MTFRDNLNELCRDRGTNLTTVIKNCGFSSSKATAINKGQIPTEEQLLTLASYLNCSVMDFFSDETPEKSVETDEERLLIEGYRNMPNSQKHRLLAYFYALQEGKE